MAKILFFLDAPSGLRTKAVVDTTMAATQTSGPRTGNPNKKNAANPRPKPVPDAALTPLPEERRAVARSVEPARPGIAISGPGGGAAWTWSVQWLPSHQRIWLRFSGLAYHPAGGWVIMPPSAGADLGRLIRVTTLPATAGLEGRLVVLCCRP